ncbi:hypothetical protein Trisim1_008509 [Trichoderma cf. simile WF8]
MSQAISTSINQRRINGTAVGVNNGSVNVNVTYEIQYVNNIGFLPNIGLQYIQYRLQLTPAELAEQEHQRAIQAWNNFKLCDLLLEIKEFQAWFNMQCQRSVLWISGCLTNPIISRSYMIEYIREKRIKRPFRSCHLLYYYVDKTVTGSSYRNLQQTLWQQADPADGVQVHVFNNQDNEDSSILDELVERLAAAQRDVYIIIDGLDQLPRRHSYELLRRLCNLSEKLKGENTYGGGHLAVAVSSQITPFLDRGKGYDKVFDLRLGPNYISSDIRKYLVNSSSDSTIFMGTTDLRRRSIQAQLDKGTNIYPCLSSSIMYKAQRQPIVF